jgi:phosphatidylinositol glycan class W
MATILSVICAVFPLLLAMSVFTEYTKWYLLMTVGIVLVGSHVLFRTDSANHDEEKVVAPLNHRIKPFLSNYRAAMMLATCIAILAVDFNLFFPKRFAKCEEYGISLMDVGVGGFIFSSALVSSRPGPTPSQQVSKSSQASKPGSSPSMLSRWLKRMRSCLIIVIPLLVLGLGRFSVIKAFGYQEHVSEYGMHWNFFMTLAGITLLVTALNIPLLYSGIVGVLILAFYQYLLEGMGVAKYILEAPRVDFFSQNREGILSCIGYLALYLFGQKIGSYLLHAQRTKFQWWRVVGYTTAGGLLLWGAAAGMTYFLDMQASRRMVNMPYVLYTLACNLFIISAFIAVDLLMISTLNPLFDAVATKRNSQLVIFTIVRIVRIDSNKGPVQPYSPDITPDEISGRFSPFFVHLTLTTTLKRLIVLKSYIKCFRRIC